MTVAAAYRRCTTHAQLWKLYADFGHTVQFYLLVDWHHRFGHALGKIVDSFLFLDDIDLDRIGRNAVGFLCDQASGLMSGGRISHRRYFILHVDHDLSNLTVVLRYCLYRSDNRLRAKR